MRHKIFGLFIFAICCIHPTSGASQVRSFPINIVVLTQDPSEELTVERAKRFVSILNSGFRKRSGGEHIFNFTLKAYSRVRDLEIQGCNEMLALGDQVTKPTKDEVGRAFDNCRDSRIVDHHAINAYLFQSSFDNGEGKSSRIYFHSFEPFVFMNVARLDNDWRMWEHEFGHVFGMPELPACGSTPKTPTNIMSHKSDLCEGTGGNRELGFEPWQVVIMNATAAIIARKIDL